MDPSSLVRAAAVDQVPEFSFQYWMDVDIDLICAIERLETGTVAQRFYFNGQTFDQQDLVLDAMLDQARASVTSVFGGVFDRRGGSMNVDWDAIVAGSPIRVSIRPDLLFLTSRVAEHHPELCDAPNHHVGDLVIFDVSSKSSS